MRSDPKHLPKAVALISPVIFSALLGWAGTTYRPYEERWEEYLERVSVDGAAELERVLADLDYFWPLQPGMSVPRIAVDPLPDDLGAVDDVDRKKSLFFRALLPIVLAETERISTQRGVIQELYRRGPPALDSEDGRVLARLMQEYRVDGTPGSESVRAALLRRVDVVPVALALAQAANESAWGASRFARLGNNLFGQWTYQEDKGIIPAARKEGHRHAVRKFSSVRRSVRAYLYNLNVGHAYESLREMRSRMRSNGEPLDPLALAVGLEGYSSRGEAYVAELRTIIRGNDLAVLSAVELGSTVPRMAYVRLQANGSTDG